MTSSDVALDHLPAVKFCLTRTLDGVERCLRRLLQGDRSLDLEAARRHIRNCRPLPEGTFSGQELTTELRQDLRSVTGAPEDETILLAYWDRLLGQILQCAVLTPRALYGSSSRGGQRRVKVQHLVGGKHDHWGVWEEIPRSPVAKFRPRSRGFFRLAEDCVSQSLL